MRTMTWQQEAMQSDRHAAGTIHGASPPLALQEVALLGREQVPDPPNRHQQVSQSETLDHSNDLLNILLFGAPSPDSLRPSPTQALKPSHPLKGLHQVETTAAEEWMDPAIVSIVPSYQGTRSEGHAHLIKLPRPLGKDSVYNTGSSGQTFPLVDHTSFLYR